MSGLNAKIDAQATQQPAPPTKGDSPSSDDAQSVLSETSTLCESAKGKGTASDSSAKTTVKLSDSATSFAKKAKEDGWGSSTATRPSLGGI